MSTIEETGVRAARPGDAGPLAALFAHYVEQTVITFETEPPSAALWRARIERLGALGLPLLVLEDGPGALVGYALASPFRDKPAYRHTLEDSVYLDPAHTGRGHGRRLLDALLRASADAGARQMVAVIADAGPPASLALHRAAGFETVGRLRGVGYKHGRWVDTVIMQRALGPDPGAGPEPAP